MMNIPRTALILGLAGAVPFVWGAASYHSDALALWGADWLGPRFIGPYIQLFYGAIILSFMSGVLWGFATKAEPAQAPTGYVLSVIPALWAFMMTGGGPTSASINLIFGFLGLLVLDYFFWSWRLAPRWWMSLRVLLSTITILSLSVTAFF
jgi:hypothetical protein